MTASLEWARRLVPSAIKERLRARHRVLTLRRALHELRDMPAGRDLQRTLTKALIYGWGNEGWTASPQFIERIVRAAWQSRGPMVECGSGLSTLLLGTIADRTNRQVWSLEHDPEWAHVVEHAVARHRIDSVRLCVGGLKSFGGYSWYSYPTSKLPEDVDLVVCDGPPGDTPGCRYGMLPNMRGNLAPGCTILLDDVNRPEDRDVLERWVRELGTTYTIAESARAFAELRVPNDRTADKG